MSILGAHQVIKDQLLKLGIFDHVAQHEPSAPPGKGLYAAMWFDEIRPSQETSVLSGADMLYVLTVRMYKSAASQPQDSIDLDLLAALDAVLDLLISNHRLDGEAFGVDVLPRASEGLRAVTDYVDFGRNQFFRVIDLSIPVVVDGVYSYAH